MLNRKFCAECYRECDKELQLFVSPDYEFDWFAWHWEHGECLCIKNMKVMLKISDKPPEDCRYILEQLMSQSDEGED